MSAQIKLSNGAWAQVDEADCPQLLQHTWHQVRSWNTHYAYRHINKQGKRCALRMHRVIMQAPDGVVVDHINHDGLDNRRANLRLVTNCENQRNRSGANRNSKTGVLNVSYNAHRKRYAVRIHVGYFKTLAEAQAAAEAARAERFSI